MRDEAMPLQSVILCGIMFDIQIFSNLIENVFGSMVFVVVVVLTKQLMK